MSQFIEMFGNPLSSIQKNELKKLGDCCQINPRRPSVSISDNDLVSFVPMPAVNEDGYIDGATNEEYGKVKKGFTYFENNDVLFAKITPCMENGKGAVAEGLTNGIGMGSTEFHILRPIKGISNPYWLLALTRMPIFREWAAKNMSGTGGQRRVGSAFLENFMIGLPSISEQDTLETIYKQADKSEFVGCKSQFIEMFYGMTTTPVKDYIDDSFPGEWGTEDKDGNGVKVIRTTNFTNSGKLNLEDVVTRNIEERKVSRKQIKKYDTILERSGGTADNPVGRVVLFEEDEQYLCNNFTQVLRFKNIDPRFAFYSLYYFYQTNKTAIRSMGSKTTGIQNLNMGKYQEIGVPNASDEQQMAFVSIVKQADKSEFVGCKSQFIEMFGSVDYNPKSYNIKKVGDFAVCFAGATPSTKIPSYWDNGNIPWMSSGEVHKGRVQDTDTKITKQGYDGCSTKMVPIHSIVVALAGQGKTRGTVAINDIELCTNQSLCAIVPNEEVNYEYLFHNLRGRYRELRSMSGDVDGRGGLNLKHIQSIKVIVPPMSEQMKFVSIARQADKSEYYN